MAKKNMDVKTFFNKTFGELDVYVAPNGGTWYYATQVGKKLGYSNVSLAVRKLVAPGNKRTLKKSVFRDTKYAKFREVLWDGNDRTNKILVNECGLYSLAMASKVEAAKDFREWVTDTVLPSIKNNGGYVSGQEELDAESQEKLFRLMRTEISRLRKKNGELKEEVAVLKKSKKALDEYCSLRERMYDTLMLDYQSLVIKGCKAPVKTVKTAKDNRYREPVRTTTTVDRFGQVLDFHVGESA